MEVPTSLERARDIYHTAIYDIRGAQAEMLAAQRALEEKFPWLSAHVSFSRNYSGGEPQMPDIYEIFNPFPESPPHTATIEKCRRRINDRVSAVENLGAGVPGSHLLYEVGLFRPSPSVEGPVWYAMWGIKLPGVPGGVIRRRASFTNATIATTSHTESRIIISVSDFPPHLVINRDQGVRAVLPDQPARLLPEKIEARREVLGREHFKYLT